MIYHIEYLRISGTRHLKTENIYQVPKLLNSILENKYNSIETIKIWTEEK